LIIIELVAKIIQRYLVISLWAKRIIILLKGDSPQKKIANNCRSATFNRLQMQVDCCVYWRFHYSRQGTITVSENVNNGNFGAPKIQAKIKKENNL